MATTQTMATAKRVMGVQRRQQGGRRKGHGRSRYDWREGDGGGDGDGDGARDMAACATTGEGEIMVAMGHTPETLNCELIVDPEVMQLINWQFQV